MSTLVATSPVVVLNASYLPLGNTRLARAMALVLKGDAVVEEADESRILRFAGGEHIFPKVIRMLKLIPVPFTYAEEYYSRSGVLRRDSLTCGYCLKTPKDGVRITVDHIVPRSRFKERPTDADTWLNTVSACVKCNGYKAARTPEEAGMTLHITPSVPMKIYMHGGKAHRKKKKK